MAMTAEDAIKHLSDKIDYAEQRDDKWVDSVSIKALYIAVKALNKQIGIPPREIEGKWETQILCPQCNHIFHILYDGMKIGGDQSPYCERCGQRIDWGKEKTDE